MSFLWLSTNDKNGGGPWQSSWRHHAVPLEENENENITTFAQLGKRRALCGLRPRHGWGMDLFLDTNCKRCEAKLAKELKQ